MSPISLFDLVIISNRALQCTTLLTAIAQILQSRVKILLSWHNYYYCPKKRHPNSINFIDHQHLDISHLQICSSISSDRRIPNKPDLTVYVNSHFFRSNTN